jgi:hypothetical protein
VIRPEHLNTLDEAQASASFQLLIPTNLPNGYKIADIEHVANTVPGTPPANHIIIHFVTTEGGYLAVEQGWPVAVENGVYQYAPDNQKGSLMVQDQPAIWVRGTVGKSDTSQKIWQPGPLAIRWIIGPNKTGGLMAYALESDALSLDELIDVANSVRPYHGN